MTFGFGVKTGEAKLQTCTTASECRAGISGSGNGQFNQPRGIVIAPNGNIWVVDSDNNRIEEFNESGGYITQIGTKGTGNLQFKEPKGIAIDSKGSLWITDTFNYRVQELTSGGSFIASFGTKGTGNGQFEEPWGITIKANGDIYVADVKDNHVEEWVGDPGAHDSKTIYYSAVANPEYPACGEHIEWVNLPCETVPVAQPGTNGLPELPTKTVTYNMWDQAETITETFGSITRTRKTTFDSAGRPLTTEETSSNDTSLPKVTDKYNTANGTLEAQSTTVGETTETITSLYNRRGELESYTDADKNTARYSYDEDGRVTKVSDGSAEGKGEQSYTYDETTGALTKLVDSGAGTFTASYDVQGMMTSESYPNGMTAYYTYNPVGTATALDYQKTTHCAAKCPETWFSDTIVPSIHGETMKQASTFSEEPNYTYDTAGRLTQVQEIPVGEGCTTRLYAYEEDSNRTSLTTRKPGTEGKCSTEGGSIESHTYDTADRLIDPGVTYEAFGNITTLPASDAGGSEGSEITSKYYVDGQVYKQTQSKETSEYELDPEDRTRETISSGTTESKVITHYDRPGSALAWTSEASGKWTRNIPGIGGELAAIQTGPTTVVLQLHDLQGNIIGTVGDSETETKLLSKYNSTEFGVPQPGVTPPKYAWLGAAGIAGESSGLIVQDGVTYVPQIGRPLQVPQDLAPGQPNNYATPYVSPIVASVAEFGAATAAEDVAKREQEISEREASNQPPGAVPSPEGGGEGEGSESGGGEGGNGGGQGDPYLPPLRRTTLKEVGCSVWATIHFSGGPVLAKAYFRCNWTPSVFELQVCIQQQGIEGEFISIVCGYRNGGEPVYSTTKGKYFYGQSSGNTLLVWCWFNLFAVRVGGGYAYSYCCFNRVDGRRARRAGELDAAPDECSGAGAAGSYRVDGRGGVVV